jgi:hypothetical protein
LSRQVFEALGFVVQQGGDLADAVPSASSADVFFVFPEHANVSFLDTAREMFSEFHALIAAGTSPFFPHVTLPTHLPFSANAPFLSSLLTNVHPLCRSR